MKLDAVSLLEERSGLNEGEGVTADRLKDASAATTLSLCGDATADDA